MEKNTKRIVKDLLIKYELDALKMSEIMFEDFKVNTKKDLILKRAKYIVGDYSISSKYTYIFHGRGCRVLDANGDIIIDWDMGYDDKMFGINIMLFLDYLEENKSDFENDLNYNDVEKIMDEFITDGSAYKKSGLYYLI